MKKHVRTIGVFALALLVGRSAAATETYEFFTGVRQMGMGGAYTGVVNDETALLSNPAGLGKVRDMTVTIVDPELSGSFNDTAIAKGTDFVKAFSPADLKTLLDQARGKHWNSKLQFFPSIIGPNVGFGAFGKYSYDAEINEAGDIYRLDYTNDYAVALGYCLRFFSGIVKIGWTVRAVDRVEIHKDLDPNQTDLTVAGNASEGMGIGADVGLIITAPVAGLPTLSAVVRDAGGTAYNLTDGMIYSTTTRPEFTKQTLDAGLSFFPILSNHVRLSFTMEYHDALASVEEFDPMKRVHVGAEFNFADFFFLRAGMNQRYWTAGVELASERFQLQAASYGEELGTSTASSVQMREDRRFVGKFAIRF